MVRQDAQRVAAVLIALGASTERVDRRALGLDLSTLLRRYAGRAVGEIALARAIADVLEITRRHSLRLPRDPGGLLGVVRVPHAEQEATLEEVQDTLEDLLLVLGRGAELREVLESKRGLKAGGAVGGDLVDDILAAGDVVSLVDEEGHAGALCLG